MTRNPDLDLYACLATVAQGELQCPKLIAVVKKKVLANPCYAGWFWFHIAKRTERWLEVEPQLKKWYVENRTEPWTIYVIFARRSNTPPDELKELLQESDTLEFQRQERVRRRA